MKTKSIVAIVIAVIILIAGCDSLWQLNERSSITFTIDTTTLQSARSIQVSNNARNGVSSIDSAIPNVTISIHNADDNSIIASKTENIDDDGKAEIEFINLKIVGKMLYAKVLFVKDGVAIGAVSETKRMTSGTNTLTIENFGEVQVVSPTISMVSTEDTPTDSPIGNKAVTLSSDTVDAQIFYTIDGTDPAANGIAYNDTPFNLLLGSEAIELQVIAKKDGYENSGVTSETYKKLLNFTYDTLSASYRVGHWDYLYEGDIIIPATHNDGVNGERNVTATDHWPGNFYESSFKSIILPDTMVHITKSAFSGSKNVSSVEIPSSVTTIESYAFAGCENLETVSIPASVDTIGEGAFTINPKLTNFILDSHSYFSIIRDNQNIAEGLFDRDTGTFIASAGGSPNAAYQFNMNLSISHIGESAFRGNNYLEIIGIPSTVESIGRIAFSDCPNLREFMVLGYNDYYQVLDGVLYTYGGIDLVRYPPAKEGELYVIPNSVISFSEAALDGSCNLISVVFPTGFLTIGARSLEGCETLQTILLPDSIISFNDNAFGYFNDGPNYTTVYAEVPSDNKFPYSQKNPIVFGCNVNRTGEPYLESISNVEIVSSNYPIPTLQAPYRTDYTFAGWSTNPFATSADLGLETADSLRTVNNSFGTYYAVWKYTP